jgi:hypothetical protein
MYCLQNKFWNGDENKYLRINKNLNHQKYMVEAPLESLGF